MRRGVALSAFLSLLISAICHDIDHPGVSNQFLINTSAPLAICYNDNSVLENHHAATTFTILSDPANNLLALLTLEQRREARQLICKTILSTDMAHHSDMVKSLTALAADCQDWDKMAADVTDLKAGKAVEKPIYNHITGELDPDDAPSARYHGWTPTGPAWCKTRAWRPSRVASSPQCLRPQSYRGGATSSSSSRSRSSAEVAGPLPGMSAAEAAVAVAAGRNAAARFASVRAATASIISLDQRREARRSRQSDTASRSSSVSRSASSSTAVRTTCTARARPERVTRCERMLDKAGRALFLFSLTAAVVRTFCL